MKSFGFVYDKMQVQGQFWMFWKIKDLHGTNGCAWTCMQGHGSFYRLITSARNRLNQLRLKIRCKVESKNTINKENTVYPVCGRTQALCGRAFGHPRYFDCFHHCFVPILQYIQRCLGRVSGIPFYSLESLEDCQNSSPHLLYFIQFISWLLSKCYWCSCCS